jgi:hypothetical protein
VEDHTASIFHVMKRSPCFFLKLVNNYRTTGSHNRRKCKYFNVDSIMTKLWPGQLWDRDSIPKRPELYGGSSALLNGNYKSFLEGKAAVA